jgi:hypothetical protein
MGREGGVEGGGGCYQCVEVGDRPTGWHHAAGEGRETDGEGWCPTLLAGGAPAASGPKLLGRSKHGRGREASWWGPGTVEGSAG